MIAQLIRKPKQMYKEIILLAQYRKNSWMMMMITMMKMMMIENMTKMFPVVVMYQIVDFQMKLQ